MIIRIFSRVHLEPTVRITLLAGCRSSGRRLLTAKSAVLLSDGVAADMISWNCATILACVGSLEWYFIPYVSHGYFQNMCLGWEP